MLAEIFTLRAEAKARTRRQDRQVKRFQSAVIIDIRTPAVATEATSQSGTDVQR